MSALDNQLGLDNFNRPNRQVFEKPLTLLKPIFFVESAKLNNVGY